jgi:hypothetical protein
MDDVPTCTRSVILNASLAKRRISRIDRTDALLDKLIAWTIGLLELVYA